MRKLLVFVLVRMLSLPLLAQEGNKDSSAAPSPELTALQTAYSRQDTATATIPLRR